MGLYLNVKFKLDDVFGNTGDGYVLTLEGFSDIVVLVMRNAKTGEKEKRH